MTSEQYDSDHQHSAVPPDDEVSLSKDTVFHLLQNPRRRAILRYLLEHDDHDQFTLSDLAEEIAAWEHETTVGDLTSDERQRVYIALYQTHLPKLAEEGIIEYDQSRGIVDPTPLIHVVDPYLEDGLHAASDDLSIADHAIEETDTTDETDSDNSLTETFSGLFRG